MQWYVYIVECADKTLYTGVTSDIQRRISEHNTSNKLGSRFIRSRRPVVLRYKERVKTRSAALRRELKIKGLSRDKKYKLILGQI